MNRDLSDNTDMSTGDPEWDNAVSAFFNKWLWIIMGSVILYGFLAGNFKGFWD